ncbi:MAG: flavoprotein [Candidatus Omnitrophica bacterium]|nr:flavoprotein [Candidatus Omnitrophota bacterium]
MTNRKKPVILGVTGSIAAYRACDIISKLRKENIDVRPILTKEAMEFITPLSVQTLARNKVVTDMFALPEEWDPVHTSIAQEAGLILIAPATANIIGKLASGICDDILSCVVFATKAPVLIAPAMNEGMYRHKIVRENIAKLKDIGYKFIGPIKGYLACGHEDIGHIARTEDIVKEVKRLLR